MYWKWGISGRCSLYVEKNHRPHLGFHLFGIFLDSNQWPCVSGTDEDWRYLPYSLGLYFRECPHNIWPEICYIVVPTHWSKWVSTRIVIKPWASGAEMGSLKNSISRHAITAAIIFFNIYIYVYIYIYIYIHTTYIYIYIYAYATCICIYIYIYIYIYIQHIYIYMHMQHVYICIYIYTYKLVQGWISLGLISGIWFWTIGSHGTLNFYGNGNVLLA